MIDSINITTTQIASHYDELDEFYRDIWGDHVHHGMWESPSDSKDKAVINLIDFMLKRFNTEVTGSIVDIGCGYGATAMYLAQKPDCHITGFTISQNQLQIARNKGKELPNVNFRLMDWLENDLPDESTDFAYSIESSEHMPDFEKFFSEASRVLKPGGKFAIFAWLENEKKSKLEEKFLLQPLCDEGRMRLATIQEYKDLLVKNGFQLESVDIISDQVSRTWSICILKGIQSFFTNPSFRKYLLSNVSANREFFITLFRIRLAFATKAMDYGLFIAKKKGH